MSDKELEKELEKYTKDELRGLLKKSILTLAETRAELHHFVKITRFLVKEHCLGNKVCISGEELKATGLGMVNVHSCSDGIYVEVEENAIRLH